jgi:hypothetical protein
MKHEQIESLILSLNIDDTSERIFKRNIGNNVEFAYVWDKIPSPSDSLKKNYEGKKIFLIKNNEQIYVAAVYLMNDDLHWFVIPSERKKGILIKAMQDCIISYLFDILADKPIRITIDKGSEFEMESIRVAELLNFKPGDEVGEYFLNMADVDWSKNKMKVIDGTLEYERMNILRQKYQYHLNSLIMISQEISSIYGNDEKIDENLANLKDGDYWIKKTFGKCNDKL